MNLRLRIKQLQSINLNPNIVFLFVFLYPLFFMWQGGDLTDTGYHMVYYQNFFNDLHIGETKSLFFFTAFLGGSWLKVFPSLGVVGLKLLFLIFYSITIFTSYKILKTLTKNNLLLMFGLLCGAMFAMRTTFFFLNYSLSSWCFLVITSYFLINGLTNKNKLSVFVSGIAFALASLSRFPNIVLLLLVPIVFLYQNIYKDDNSIKFQLLKSMKEYSLFLFGFLSLLFLFFAILYIGDILNIYYSNFDILVNSLDTNTKESHGVIKLFNRYLTDIKSFLPHLIIITSLFFSIGLLYNFKDKIKYKYLFYVYLIVLFFTINFFYKGLGWNSHFKYLVPAFCFFPLLSSVLKKDKFSLTTIVLSLVALAQVAGTLGNFFLKLKFGLMILIPLAIIILAESDKISFKNVSIYTKPIVNFGIFVILYFSLISNIGWIYGVGKGHRIRTTMTFPIDHAKMRGIYTTSENADHIEKISSAIDKNIREDNILLIFGHQPLVYYLTDNKPAIHKFWLKNDGVQLNELFILLDRSQKKLGKWPMIVDTKESVLGKEGDLRLAEFLNQNNYIEVASDERFTIWNKSVD